MKRYNINLSRFKCTAKALLGGVLVSLFGACDDFLTIYPTNSVVLENYWKVEADVDGMVANCYRSMIQFGFMERFLVWGEIRSDNVMEGNFNNGGNSSLRDINEINLMPTNGYCSWADYYKVINNCHIVRKYAPGVVDKDPDYTKYDLKNHEGEMQAISALCHFYLVRAYRDIPLLKEAIVDDSQNLYQEQVGPIEALDWIIEELKEAEGKVIQSGNYISNNENKGRITTDAVRAILADALLWRASFKTFDGRTEEAKADYTECIDYCEQILEARRQYMKKYVKANPNSSYKKLADEKYPLVKSYPEIRDFANGDDAYDEVFGVGQNSIPESIFELQMTGDVENQNYLVTYYYGREKGQNAPFVAGKNLLDMYALTDYRRESFILTPKTEEEPAYILKYTTSGTSGKFTGDGTEPLSPNYHTTHEQTDNTKANHGKRYINNCNWIVYRLSDVMLMKAEALAYRNESGDRDASFELVEAVYYRSNDKEMISDDTKLLKKPADAASMQQMVLDERQRELAFEGKRWFDLVRKALRITKTTAEGESVNDISSVVDVIVSGKYVSNPKSYKNKMPDINYFFFPIYERDLNTYAGEENAGKLKQNPAYETESSIEKN